MELQGRLHRSPGIYRSSPWITPEPTGPLSDRNSPIGRPRGVGSIANFNLPKYPRRPNYRGNSPSTMLVQNEPLAYSNRVRPERTVTELLSVQMSLYSGNSLANSPTRTVLNQQKKDKNEPIHLTHGFIYNGAGGHVRSRVIRI